MIFDVVEKMLFCIFIDRAFKTSRITFKDFHDERQDQSDKKFDIFKKSHATEKRIKSFQLLLSIRRSLRNNSEIFEKIENHLSQINI